MLKKGLIVLAWLQMVMSMQAVVYKLERVDTIVSGGQYVFVDKNNSTMKAEITSDHKLQSEPINVSTACLTGAEKYVWTVDKVQGLKKYYIYSGNDQVSYEKNSDAYSLTIIPKSFASQYWVFEWNSDKVQIVALNATKCIGLTGSSSTEYKMYEKTSTLSYPSKFSVYRLVPETYEREVSSTNLGTICLPFAVDEHNGADVYQIAYKELDANLQPCKMYYQLVEGRMEAGRPYIFVPEQAGTITFTAVPGTYVYKPIAPEDGFYGTFAGISDGASLEGKYMINGNSQFQLCGAGCSLGANRAYIVMDEVPMKEDVPAPTRRVMVIGEQSQPTYYNPQSGVGTGMAYPIGSSRVTKSMHDGKLIITVDDKHYNTLGHQL